MGGFSFHISADTALLYDKMKMSAEMETEDKTEGEQNYVSIKNGKAVQITFSVFLEAALGMDVKEYIKRLLHSAQRGIKNYLYISGEKIFPFLMMMVKAEADNIQKAPSGAWISATVNLTMKQASPEAIDAESSGEYGSGQSEYAWMWEGLPTYHPGDQYDPGTVYTPHKQSKKDTIINGTSAQQAVNNQNSWLAREVSKITNSHGALVNIANKFVKA